MKNKIKLLAIIAIFFLMIMSFGAVKAEDVHVNRDSIGTNGAVNQVVVVHPQTSQRSRIVVKEPIVNNYYNQVEPSVMPYEPVGCSNSGQSKNLSCYPVVGVPDSKFDYQDIWLIVLTILFALGLGMFIGYLIWNRRGGSRQVIVHSHGGRSTSSSYSRSGTRSVRGMSNSPLPITPAPLPSSPAPASSGQAATEEKK